MESEAVLSIKEIAAKYQASVQMIQGPEGDYIDCIVNQEETNLYIIFTRFSSDYYAYTLSGDWLPRELYSDIISKNITEKDRSKEILSNVKTILAKECFFYPKPRLFKRNRGYIVLPVDDKLVHIYLEKNFLSLPDASSQI